MPRRQIHGSTERGRAYESLRKELILRRLASGEKLVEQEWARRLDVNRGALREALARLHSEGLVVEGEKCGYRVPTYTPEELQEIREVSRILESGAIESIIKRGRTRREHLRRLHELCDELEWILARGYRIELAEADHRFHETLVQLSEQQRLILLYRCLPQTLNHRPDLQEDDRIARARCMLGEHRAIIDALSRSQLESARNLMKRHHENENRDVAGPCSAATLVVSAG